MSFPTTNWTNLAHATLNGDAVGRSHLATLCQTYRPAIAMFIRNRGIAADEVEDATQAFFEKLLTTSLWSKADRSKGRFRNFLCASVIHMLQNQWRAENRLKRNSGNTVLSLEVLSEENDSVEPATDPTQSRQFDLAWAHYLMDTSLQRLAADYAHSGKSERFTQLRAFLPGSQQTLSQEATATALGISPNALRIELLRLREKLKAYLRMEIAKTVDSPQAIDDEMAYLHEVLIHGLDLQKNPRHPEIP